MDGWIKLKFFEKYTPVWINFDSLTLLQLGAVSTNLKSCDAKKSTDIFVYFYGGYFVIKILY